MTEVSIVLFILGYSPFVRMYGTPQRLYLTDRFGRAELLLPVGADSWCSQRRLLGKRCRGPRRNRSGRPVCRRVVCRRAGRIRSPAGRFGHRRRVRFVRFDLDLHAPLHTAEAPVLKLLVRLETFADEHVAAVVLHDFRIDVRIDFLGSRVPEQLLRIEFLAVRFLYHDISPRLPQVAGLVMDRIVGRQHGIDRRERIVLIGRHLHTLGELAVRLARQRITFEQRGFEMIRTAAVLRHDNRQVFAVFGHHHLYPGLRFGFFFTLARE